MPEPLALSPADIQPMAGAAPAAPAPAPEEAPAPGGPTNPAAMLEMLPAEVLDNDLIFAVAKGQPGAVSAPKKSKDPVVKVMVKHAEPLVAAGFGLYQTIDGKTDVLYNRQLVDVGDLQEADQQDRLGDLVTPFDQVKTAGAGAPAAPGAAPALPSAPMTPESQPAPSVQNKLATQRTKNLMPSSPTGGPAPGAGQILNSILKQPI